MTRVSREIIKLAGCNVVDSSLTTVESHKKDLSHRLGKQEKALVKTIAKGWDGKGIIEQSIVDLKKTLSILQYVKNASPHLR